MSDTIEFGIISNFDKNYDYSVFNTNMFSNWKEMTNSYNCISIPFDTINSIYSYFKNMQTYACIYGIDMSGIDLYGVTLIPPTSICDLIQTKNTLCNSINIKDDNANVKKLFDLFEKAASRNRYVICFGV